MYCHFPLHHAQLHSPYLYSASDGKLAMDLGMRTRKWKHSLISRASAAPVLDHLQYAKTEPGRYSHVQRQEGRHMGMVSDHYKSQTLHKSVPTALNKTYWCPLANVLAFSPWTATLQSRVSCKICRKLSLQYVNPLSSDITACDEIPRFSPSVFAYWKQLQKAVIKDWEKQKPKQNKMSKI